MGLKHILGDSHQLPTPTVLNGPSEAQDIDTVLTATLQAPSKTTKLSSRFQREFMAGIANELCASMREGNLHFCLSTKHPHAWLSDMLIALDLETSSASAQDDPVRQAVKALCDVYNKKTAGWLDLVEKMAHRSLIVRHEDILTSQGATIMRMSKALNRKSTKCWAPRGIACGTTWDDQPVTLLEREFDRAYYVNGEYMNALGNGIAELIDELIEWDTLKPLSYQPGQKHSVARTH